MMSTNPVWAGLPLAYASYMSTLSERFRVIAPDARRAGKTRHYRALSEAEMAVVPNIGHIITPPIVAAMVDLLERWS